MAKAPLTRDMGREPHIVGFVCNWGAYSAVEAAGVNRIRYPSNVRLIRLTCLGRVHTGMMLKAFELGADGVLLLGCLPEVCHYGSGAQKARDSVAEVKKMLNLLGMGSKRVHLVEVPAGDGEFVARRINAFEKRVREMGPSPVKHMPKQIELAGELPGFSQETL